MIAGPADRAVDYIVKFDARLVWLNLGLLLCIAFLPFPTALIGEHEGDRVAVLLYASAMTVTGLASASLWRYASDERRLVGEGDDEPLTRYVLHRSLVVPAAFLPSLAVAFFSARAAELLWILAFPILALIRRLHRQTLA